MRHIWSIGGIVVIAFLGFMALQPAPGASQTLQSAQDDEHVSAGSTQVEPETLIVVAPGAAAASSPIAERTCGASSSCRNGEDGVAIAVLMSGTIPARRTTAVVQTDTNCEPDAYGISHCSNILRLADGSLMEVRHDHNMQIYPCLDPGETVTVEGQSSVS